MDIEIIGTESLGVRGLCCFVKTKKRRILIDPGIALGYTRYGLLPHPFQVRVDEKIQKTIVEQWSIATDVVISHFHGDHVPLEDANPYQLNIKKLIGLNSDVRIWSKSLQYLSKLERKRALSLSSILKKNLINAENKKSGVISFSDPLPHGDSTVKVMMTRIEENGVFVHASDIQLLDDKAISKILEWKPDILFAGCPPLYLSNRLSRNQIENAWANAKLLSEKVNVLILDHHLMRSYDGIKWLKRLSYETGKRIMCGADFMKKPRMLLEAKRKKLYKAMPVPHDWHENYAKGKVNINDYSKFGKYLYE